MGVNKFCGNCGNPVNSDAAFCGSCGNKLKTEIDIKSLLPKQYKDILGNVIEFDFEQVRLVKNGTSYGYDRLSAISPKYNTGWKKDIGVLSFKLQEDNCLIKSDFAIYFSMNEQTEMKVLSDFLTEKRQYFINKEIEELKREHRKKCNVCGEIFCYTGSDLARNEQLDKDATFAAGLSMISGLGGNSYHMYENEKQFQSYQNQIVDYNKCPKCGSRDLVELDSNSQSKSSEDNAFEEIKKYKNLLDDGIISQEDFDKKKKELLNL